MSGVAPRLKGMARDAFVIVAATVALLLAMGEIAVRAKDRLAPQVFADYIEPDTRLGWRPLPDFRFDGERLDAANVARPTTIRTDANGFREFGSASSGRCKIFFVGDSFTFAKDVSQDETYYYRLGQELNVEVFAYGGPGYNSLQEYLVLDQWIDQIQPDLVVWQLCENDFISNTLELNLLSTKDQCKLTQPYLQPDGSILYINPGHGMASRLVSWTHSRFLASIAFRLDNANGLPAGTANVQDVIEAEGAAHAMFQRSEKITNKIFERFKARCGNVPLIAFDVSMIQPFNDAFSRICVENGIAFENTIAEALQTASGRGETTLAQDRFHWNPRGHEIAAAALRGSLLQICGQRLSEASAI